MTLRILTVCLGNICRSPAAAAAILEAAETFGVDVEVDSAGTGSWHIGQPPHPDAIAAGKRVGLDVIGRAVNRCFLLGRGRGIRISEPVYRKLPSGDRSPWDKHRPPTVYALGELGAHPYARLGQSAEEMARFW